MSAYQTLQAAPAGRNSGNIRVGWSSTVATALLRLVTGSRAQTAPVWSPSPSAVAQVRQAGALPTDDANAGMILALAALVDDLAATGALDRASYHERLTLTWLDLPREVALGDTGAVLEQLLEAIRRPGDCDAAPAAVADD